MIYKGKLVHHETRRIAIVASRFNTLIVEQLIKGAEEALEMHGVASESIDIIWVPGALEIPLAANKLVQTNQYDGIVTLGAVIKGDTDHYDLVINGASNGIAQVGLNSNIPIVFGVLTTDTLEQAQHRSGAKAGNKGSEVAISLLELLSVYDQIDSEE